MDQRFESSLRRGTNPAKLDEHIRHCVMAAEGEEREAKLAELTESIERFTRTIA